LLLFKRRGKGGEGGLSVSAIQGGGTVHHLEKKGVAKDHQTDFVHEAPKEEEKRFFALTLRGGLPLISERRDPAAYTAKREKRFPFRLRSHGL